VFGLEAAAVILGSHVEDIVEKDCPKAGHVGKDGDGCVERDVIEVGRHRCMAFVTDSARIHHDVRAAPIR
jgi:hypothetical protein